MYSWKWWQTSCRKVSKRPNASTSVEIVRARLAEQLLSILADQAWMRQVPVTDVPSVAVSVEDWGMWPGRCIIEA